MSRKTNGYARQKFRRTDFEFENWDVIALGGIPNKMQIGDMGISTAAFFR
jgi:hypothetical protein